MGLEPEHISFYGLTIEPGTPFSQQQKEGRLPLPIEEIQAAMYEEGIRRLGDAGLGQYEISNFSREGKQSIHNRLYWENLPTLGLGAGAWSYDGSRRWGRVRLPEYYAEKALAGDDTGLPGERLQGPRALGEAAMLGLRLLEGISLQSWRKRTGRDWMDDFAGISQRLSERGLLRLERGRIRLAKRALPLADEVFSEFV
jgi:oxygen-independent coproporphyrinogen-3 oxidase